MRNIIGDSNNNAIANSDMNLIVNRDSSFDDTIDVKYPDFARRFRLMCKESNAPRTQKELAKWLGYSQPTINDWLNGNKLPSMDTAIELSTKFDCSLDWLMTGRGNTRIEEMETIYDLLDKTPLTDAQKNNFKALIDSFMQQNTGNKRRTGD